MKRCLTKELLSTEVSGCLLETPHCSHAHQFGFSIVCCHPDHSQFHAHAVGTMTTDEASARYAALKQKRRDEFVARLDEESRRYFCLQSDYHGKPLTSRINRTEMAGLVTKPYSFDQLQDVLRGRQLPSE